MPDIFSVDARGRILRNPTTPGYPSSVAETMVVSYNLTADEIAGILARPVTDPVRIAYTTRANAGGIVTPDPGSGGSGVTPTAFSPTIDFRSNKSMPVTGFYSPPGNLAFAVDDTGAIPEAETTAKVRMSSTTVVTAPGFTLADPIPTGAGDVLFDFVYSGGIPFLFAKVLGASSGGVSPSLRQVANRTYIPSLTSTSVKQMRGVTQHRNTVAVTSLSLVFPAWFVHGAFNSSPSYQELPAGGSIQWTAAVEYPIGNSSRYQVTFSGSPTGTAANGAEVIGTVAVTIPADTPYLVHWMQKTTDGFVVWAGSGATSNPSATFNASLGDRTDTGSNLADITMGGSYDNNFADNAGGPIVIASASSAPAVLNIDTSIGWGHGDQQNADGGGGEVCRSLNRKIAYVNAGVSGDYAYKFLASHDHRVAMATYFTHVIVGGPTNDLVFGRSANTINSDLQSLYALFPGKKIFQCTPLPIASSGGATTSANAERIALRSLMLGSQPALTGVFDLGPVVESTLNSGVWELSSDTLDGVHPTSAGYTKLQTSGVIDTTKIYVDTPTATLVPPTATPTAVISDTTTNSFKVNVDVVPNATDYLVEYKLSTASTWTTLSKAASPVTAWVVSGLPATTPAGQYQARVTPKNGAGSGPTSSVVSVTLTASASAGAGVAAPTITGSPELVRYFDFNDSSTVSATSGYITSIASKGTTPLTLTASGAARPAQVQRNGLNAAYFDGSAQQFLQATGLSLPYGGTFMAVFELASVGANQVIMDRAKLNSTFDFDRTALVMLSGDSFRVWKGNASVLTQATASGTPAVGAHALLGVAAGAGSAYVAFDGAGALPSSASVAQGSASAVYTLGAMPHASTATDAFFNGWLKAVLEWNAVFTDAQAQQAMAWAAANFGNFGSIGTGTTPTPAPVPVNSVAPAISGTPQVGQTLTVSNGTWSNTPTGYTYQWKRAGTNISGATAQTYVPVSADVGNTLTCAVVASNAGGAGTAATSAATAAVTAASVGTTTFTFDNLPDSNSSAGNGLTNFNGSIAGIDTGRLSFKASNTTGYSGGSIKDCGAANGTFNTVVTIDQFNDGQGNVIRFQDDMNYCFTMVHKDRLDIWSVTAGAQDAIITSPVTFAAGSVVQCTIVLNGTTISVTVPGFPTLTATAADFTASQRSSFPTATKHGFSDAKSTRGFHGNATFVPA